MLLRLLTPYSPVCRVGALVCTGQLERMEEWLNYAQARVALWTDDLFEAQHSADSYHLRVEELIFSEHDRRSDVQRRRCRRVERALADSTAAEEADDDSVAWITLGEPFDLRLRDQLRLAGVMTQQRSMHAWLTVCWGHPRLWGRE